jgi:hypothetical protein
MSRAVYHLVGDVHGHAVQLRDLLMALGYTRPDPATDPACWEPPDGATLVSVGDLVDRGLDSLGALEIVVRLAREGRALMVLGNHDVKMIGLLCAQLGLGPEPRLGPGRLMTWVELLGETEARKRELLELLERVPRYLELDEGRLVVTHARWSPSFRRLDGEALIQACAFGRVDGDPAEGSSGEDVPDGVSGEAYLEISRGEPLPARARWVRGYRGRALVVWGHQHVRRDAVVRVGNTVNIESGCFLGHALSAYVYPEGRVVQVRGSHHWKSRIAPYAVAGGLVFPRSLDEVRRTLEDNGLTSVEDYLAWIELILEACGAPGLVPELVATHRRIHARAVA